MIKLKHLLPECNECARDWNHGHDHEAGMAKNELRDMISNASKIDSMVGEGDNLPGWVSAYISLAADYMHSVSEYLAGESSRMQEPGPGYSEVINEDTTKVQNILDDFEKRIQFALDFQTGPSKEPLDIIKHKSKLFSRISNDYISGKITDDSLKRDKEIQAKSDKIAQDYDNYQDWLRNLDEKKKPSAGLTKAQKSSVAKKAVAGKDIGKKGPGFEKVAKAAEKKYGSKEAGQRVAAAAMWKNVKR